jgi:hypothetical protein
MISNRTRRLVRLAFLTCVGLSQSLGDAHAVKDLALLDASFASQVINRDPVRISQSCRLGSLTDSRLWFWMHVSCTGACEQKLAAKGHVKIFLDWYLEEEGILKKQASLPLNVKATNWRTWALKRVKPGAWVVVVRAEDSQWVCVKERCDFGIEVKEGKTRSRQPS